MKPNQQMVFPKDPEQRLSVKDIAALFRRSVSGIWAATARGDFVEPERHGNRCTRWRWGAIQEWLDNQSSKENEVAK